MSTHDEPSEHEPEFLLEGGLRPPRRLHSYNFVLLLLLVQIVVLIASGSDAVDLAIAAGIQAVTVVLVFQIGGRSDRIRRLGTIVAGVIVIAIAGSLALGSDEFAREVIRTLQVVLNLIGIVVIGDDVRRHIRIDVRTAIAALCIYLQLGLLFAAALALLEALTDTPALSGPLTGKPGDFVYFSFTTLTTTGYGDVTAATRVARSFAIAEALIGQIYLVTVVALVVSRLGTNRVVLPTNADDGANVQVGDPD